MPEQSVKSLDSKQYVKDLNNLISTYLHFWVVGVAILAVEGGQLSAMEAPLLPHLVPSVLIPNFTNYVTKTIADSGGE